MTEPSNDDTAKDALSTLHERVNEMLDMPVPQEADSWAPPLDTPVKDA